MPAVEIVKVSKTKSHEIKFVSRNYRELILFFIGKISTYIVHNLIQPSFHSAYVPTNFGIILQVGQKIAIPYNYSILYNYSID